MELKTGPEEPILSWCTSCWKDRILTTNGKCRTCGTDLLKRHWKTSIKKLEIIIEKPEYTPIEIKGMMYLIPQKMILKFQEMSDYPSKVKFIESVKLTCKSYKI